MTFTFNTDIEGIRLASVCVATLVKEGVVFTIKQDSYSVEIKLTGGF